MELRDSVQLTLVYYSQPSVNYSFMPEEAQRLSDDFSAGPPRSGQTISSGTYHVINSEGQHYAVYLDFCKIRHITPPTTSS